jgi:hypothetical protein
MASHAMKLNEGKKISSSNQGNEVSQSDLDLHWWCRKHKDNIVDDLDYEIVAKTLESIVNMGLPSLYPGGDEQMNLSSFFNYANLEFVNALCCLCNNPGVVSTIHELVEDHNLDIFVAG